MSNEVKRYIVASKDAHDFDLERIGPLAHERLMVCDTDYAALEAECERLSKLSVTSLMLDVVPGCDGGGVEIYAQSVADVDAKFGQLVEQAETAEQERDALRTQLEAIRAAGGEVVEVAAHFLIPRAGSHVGERFAKAGIPSDSLNSELYTTEPLMTVSQHQRIVVAMAAELADAKSARDAYAQNAIDLQKQRDALRAELERVRQGSLFLLDAHAELEAARKQSAQAFKDELIKATRAILHPHIEGVFAVFQQQVAGQNHNQEETPNE